VTTGRSFSSTALIHVSPETYDLYVDGPALLINGIDNPEVADPETITPVEGTAEPLDIIMMQRIFRQTVKGGIEAANSRCVNFLVKPGSLSGEFNLIHSGEST